MSTIIWLVTAEHREVPGRLLSLHATEELALKQTRAIRARHGRDLANIDMQPLPVERESDGDASPPVETPAERRLPAMCVAVLPGAERPVVIRSGEPKPWKWASSTAAGMAFNQQHGITGAQVAAMVAGLTKGWDHPDAWPSRATAETQEG